MNAGQHPGGNPFGDKNVPSWGEKPQYAAPGSYPPVPNYLVLSILSLLFCGGVIAIPAIVFAAQVDSKLKAGDYNGAVESSRKARTWLVVAVSVASSIFLLSMCCVIGIMITGGIAGAR